DRVNRGLALVKTGYQASFHARSDAVFSCQVREEGIRLVREDAEYVAGGIFEWTQEPFRRDLHRVARASERDGTLQQMLQLARMRRLGMGHFNPHRKRMFGEIAPELADKPSECGLGQSRALVWIGPVVDNPDFAA